MLGEFEDVLAWAAAGAGEAEVGGVDAEAIHVLEQFDLLADRRPGNWTCFSLVDSSESSRGRAFEFVVGVVVRDPDDHRACGPKNMRMFREAASGESAAPSRSRDHDRCQCNHDFARPKEDDPSPWSS